ncbi:Hypothetical leucine rich repeat protein [Ectocarpus siliculosus]|uniref:Hypothetical leucine rich repeat protein n=1 Tax=Ectocarpus siliculosus TaxID=2880 RepID=D7FSS3_ECTSI|nr:Hypothetical leucine rich repeat protein [Ectocarpus siliculosus]|eukprot:CBJ31214.1 Hypothetical leucine rich repeat protein [Ectocarpus siliculosus]
MTSTDARLAIPKSISTTAKSGTKIWRTSRNVSITLDAHRSPSSRCTATSSRRSPWGFSTVWTLFSLLSLHANQFTSLPAELFDGLDQLQILHLLGNNLTTLPSGLFDGLHALSVLSLSENALVALPAGIFDDLGSLQALYLQHNSLSMLRVGLFDDLESLTQL